MAETTSISVKGDRQYVRHFKRRAEDLDVKMGMMVRKALDVVYGEDLSQLERFFELNGTEMHHSEREDTNVA